MKMRNKTKRSSSVLSIYEIELGRKSLEEKGADVLINLHPISSPFALGTDQRAQHSISSGRSQSFYVNIC